MPRPRMVICFFVLKDQPQRFASRARHSATVTPSSWVGRRMTMDVTPQALAARSFSAKPPAAPVSLVTRYRTSSIRSMASLIS